MPRSPDGVVAQRASRAGRFAHAAAVLHEAPAAHFARNALGVNLGADALRRRDGDWHESEYHRKPGRKPARGPYPRSRTTPAFRRWVLVNEPAAGLDVSLVRFPGEGVRQSELIERLEELPGVRQIIETARDRDVYAVLVIDGPGDRRRLRDAVRPLQDRMFWDEVEYETFQPTLRTWRFLARRAANADGLIGPSAPQLPAEDAPDSLGSLGV